MIILPRHPDDPFADYEYNWVYRGEPKELSYIKKSEEREKVYQFNKAFFAKYYGTQRSRTTSKVKNTNSSR